MRLLTAAAKQLEQLRVLVLLHELHSWLHGVC